MVAANKRGGFERPPPRFVSMPDLPPSTADPGVAGGGGPILSGSGLPLGTAIGERGGRAMEAPQTMSRSFFELYIFLITLGHTVMFVTANISFRDLLEYINTPALVLVVLFQVRRLLEASALGSLMRAKDSFVACLPILMVVVYVCLLLAITLKASHMMVQHQFVFLMHTYWMWLLIMLLCYNWATFLGFGGAGGSPGATEGVAVGGVSGSGSGGSAKSLQRSGSGKRSGKAGAGGAGGSRGGAGRQKATADDISRLRVANIERQILSEIWRTLRTIFLEVHLTIYVSCILPLTSVRRVELFNDTRCCAAISAFFLLQLLLLLSMQHLSSNWARYCQWADILGSWAPLSAQSLANINLTMDQLHKWTPGNCYLRGFVVKLNGRAYVASGKYNAAYPESRVSWCIQLLTSARISPISVLLLVQLVLMLVQVICIQRTTYWKPMAVNFMVTYFNLYLGLYLRRITSRIDKWHNRAG